MASPARDVTLSPLEAADEKTLTEAAMLLTPALDGRHVSVGEEVEAAGLKLLVTGTTPPGRVRVRGDATSLTLTPRPPRRDRRLVFDALVLVDASWSMGRERDRRFAPFKYVPYALAAFAKHAEDVVRAAAVATFSRDGFLEQDFAPVGMMEPFRLNDAVCRGRAHLDVAIDFGLGVLAHGADPRDRHAMLLFTDARKVDADAFTAAERAARMDVQVHVVDVGDAPNPDLARLAERSGGTYAHAPHTASLARAVNAMADEVEVPLHWDEPPPDVGEDDVEFEVVLKALPDDDPRIRP